MKENNLEYYVQINYYLNVKNQRWYIQTYKTLESKAQRLFENSTERSTLIFNILI